MKKTKTKIESLGFTRGHIQVLTVAFIVIGGLIVFKSGINITTMFANADDEAKPTLTYEQVAAEVAAEQSGQTSTAEADREAEEQFALLDRSIDNGMVLGDSIGLGEIPNSDEIFLQSDLEKIKVNTIATTTATVKAYEDEILYIESKSDLITILSNINSGDTDTLTLGKQQALELARAMGNVSVPNELVEFHRYKIMYAISLSNISEVWLKERPETDLQVQTQLMLSTMNKIESLRQAINQKYSASL